MPRPLGLFSPEEDRREETRHPRSLSPYQRSRLLVRVDCCPQEEEAEGEEQRDSVYLQPHSLEVEGVAHLEDQLMVEEDGPQLLLKVQEGFLTVEDAPPLLLEVQEGFRAVEDDLEL